VRTAYRQATARIDEVVARLSAPVPNLPVSDSEGDYPTEFTSNVPQAE
jgi:hypothetical protein